MADYDRIGSSDPIGKVLLGYNRKGLEIKHWKEMIENPRRPIVHWHVLKVNLYVQYTQIHTKNTYIRLHLTILFSKLTYCSEFTYFTIRLILHILLTF